jgi:hypothetical protein
MGTRRIWKSSRLEAQVHCEGMSGYGTGNDGQLERFFTTRLKMKTDLLTPPCELSSIDAGM